MISSGIPKRHEWRHSASVAETSFVGYSSTYLVIDYDQDKLELFRDGWRSDRVQGYALHGL